MRSYKFLFILALLLLVGSASADWLNLSPVDDAYYQRFTSTGNTWSQIRDNATGTSTNLTSQYIYVNLKGGTGSENYTMLVRSGLVFDGSGLVNSSAVIDNVTLRLYMYSGYGYGMGNTSTQMVRFSPPSYTNLSNNSFYNTAFTNNTPIGTGVYTIVVGNYTLPLSDYSIINKTGYFGIGLKTEWDRNNTFDGTFADGGETKTYFYSVNDTTIGHRPELNIQYHYDTDVTPPASITGLTNATPTGSTITWSWVNPETDFETVQVYKNGIFFHNVTSNTDAWTGLEKDAPYTISTHTCDSAGNCNSTWVNSTATTDHYDYYTVSIEPFDDMTYQRYKSTGNTWSEIRDGYGTSTNENSSYLYVDVRTGNSTDNFTVIDRAGMAFNGNDFGTGLTAIIDSATLQMYGYTKATGIGDISADLVPFTPYTYNELNGNELYQEAFVNNTTIGTSFTDATSGNHTVTITDLSTINLFGNFGIGMKSGWDRTNNYNGTFANLSESKIYYHSINSDVDGKHPVLSITYHYPDIEYVAPASITNLTGSATGTTIAWRWANPPDTDYYLAYIYKDGIYLENVTSPTQSTIWSGLEPATSYTISIKTVDRWYNMNTTWVNKSVTTPAISINEDLGWTTVIDNDYLTGSITNNNTFIAMASFTQDASNETLTLNANNLTWGLTPNPYGQLYIGQLYPAGHTKYRFNVSIVRNESLNASVSPSIGIANGRLMYLKFAKVLTYQRISLYYYDINGTVHGDKYIQTTSPYIDFDLEYFSNGTTVLSNNEAPYTSVSIATYRADTVQPYDYTTSTLFKMDTASGDFTPKEIIFYNFEQAIPKNRITITTDNKKFAFGFDGVHANYTYGAEWLYNNGQRATFWMQPSYYNAFNTTQQNRLQDLINVYGFELGNHFTGSFNLMTWDEAMSVADSETAWALSTFGTPSLSWESLGNSETSYHAQAVWDDHNLLWRNVPNSNAGAYSGIYAMYSACSVPTVGCTNDNMARFWDVASQYNTFTPAYTHNAVDPLIHTSSVNETDFERVMGRYVSGGVKIVPYAEWYYESVASVLPINNISISASGGSSFSVNTNGYNATTTIYDAYYEGAWYSDTGRVWTTIDNSAETNITINNPSESSVRKANATFDVSSDNITINITTWETSGTHYKKWNESSLTPSVITNHTIGDFGVSHLVAVKKNGVAYNTYTSNESGYINFSYTDGYSDVQFEAEDYDIPVVTPPTYCRNV